MNEVFRPLSVGDQVKFLLFNEDEVVTMTCTGTSDETATFIDENNKEFYMDESEVLYAKNGDGDEIGTRFYEDSEREILYERIIDDMDDLSYEQLKKVMTFIMIKKLTMKRIRESIREEEYFPTKILLSLEKDKDYIYLRPRWMYRNAIAEELEAAGIKFEKIIDNGLVYRIESLIDVEVDEIY